MVAGAEPTASQAAAAHGLGAAGTILRFDLHQRLQHGLMALSFTLLVLTGWPLSAQGSGASQRLADLFGGVDGCGLVHRIAAAVMIISSLYHLAYLGVLLIRSKLAWSMLPVPKDFQDVTFNLLYFLGIRKEKPRFRRYTYFEKFDYWAVFWGMVIMAGSGLVLWFPAQVASIAPPWFIQVCMVAHADEALLAALAIFIWHFYNVHLRPGIFPMSWVFLTGRVSVEQLAEEHPLEWEELRQAALQQQLTPVGPLPPPGKTRNESSPPPPTGEPAP